MHGSMGSAGEGVRVSTTVYVGRSSKVLQKRGYLATAIVYGALLFGTCADAVHAQSYGTWSDDGTTITAIGDGKTFAGNCEGKDVKLIGNDQTVTLHGACRNIESRGNGKHVRFVSARSLKVTGNDCVFTYKKKPGSINTLGNDNTLKAG